MLDDNASSSALACLTDITANTSLSCYSALVQHNETMTESDKQVMTDRQTDEQPWTKAVDTQWKRHDSQCFTQR